MLSLFLVLLVCAPVRDRWLQLYAGDSLYTLAPVPLLGLFFVSALLVYFLWLCNHVKTAALQVQLVKLHWIALLAVDVIIITVAYWFLLSIVPQVYYGYYLIVFDQLPLQWVITPMSASQYYQTISFTGPTSAHAHVSGWVYWVMFFGSGLRWVQCAFAVAR